MEFTRNIAIFLFDRGCARVQSSIVTSMTNARLKVAQAGAVISSDTWDAYHGRYFMRVISTD